MSTGHFAPRGDLPDADLRSASAIDADDVAALLSELGYPCGVDDARERILAVTANDRQALVVARSGGRVCGLVALDFMYYLPLGTTTCRITALVVTDTAKGQGLGRQLLKEAERRARFAGAARLELTSGSQRTDAHAFYRACGFSDGTLRFIKRLGDA
ncbi:MULTISPECIES: GNAT family N-acetyltransferase [unclassified Luteimonas]|uniref:GNAT family N-acetyltransferase n=1 Tax=unclassified Luteimonas TaxID=2629088 RepID=UPI00161AD54F|nr:GNAT family N-acetyltransferase [Luteimonas sp. RC10]MBB3345242.1 GNAT superfamily N-acetyltransferase [Luteimonas sp. RC10]